MSEHDIINSWELVQTERERWADKLAPKHIPGDDCCTYGTCTAGHGCPVRQTAADGICETSGIQCATPWTCAPACKLVTGNSDGSRRDDPPTLADRLAARFLLAASACVAVAFIAAVYQFYWG